MPPRKATKKRQRPASSSTTSASKRVRIAAAPEQPKASLLSIPFEIRQQILNRLLKLNEPVFYSPLSRRRKLWPEILTTCKQLRDEGEPILYGNTLGVQVGDDLSASITATGFSSVWVPILPKVLASRYNVGGENISDLPREVGRFTEIDIDFYAKRDAAGNDNRQVLRQAFATLAKEIDRRPNWRRINLSLHGEDFTNLTHPNIPAYAQQMPHIHLFQGPVGQHLSVYVLQPLLFLRDREWVYGDNVNSYMASKLRRCLQKSGPSENINEMLIVLESYVSGMAKIRTAIPEHAWGGDGSFSEDDFIATIQDRLERGCRSAVLAEDADRFARNRQIVLRMVALLNVWRHRCAYSADGVNLEEDKWSVKGSLTLVGGVSRQWKDDEKDSWQLREGARFMDVGIQILNLGDLPF